MNRPVVNIQDPIVKTVGRRKSPSDSLAYGLSLQKTLNELVRLGIPKGVYRFHSHKEADEWWMKHLIQNQKS